MNCRWVRTWKLSVNEHQPDLNTGVCVCVSLCVFVCVPSLADANVELEGLPVAPLDVRCHDANKDYVVVTWKQPAVEGGSSILGYFIDRLVNL